MFLLALPLYVSARTTAETKDLVIADTLASSPRDSLTRKTEHKGWAKLISALTNVDTNYVKPNHYKMQAMAYSDMMFNIYKISGSDENGENQQSLVFAPYNTMHIGPYMAYSIIFLGYSFNFGRKQTSAERSNMFFSIYSPIIGVDYYYQKGVNNYRLKRVSGFNSPESRKINNLRFSGMDTYLQNLNVYYVFNHKKFSYTAAYSQSGQQLRSAGSWMLGFNYAKQKLNFNYKNLPQFLLYDDEGNDILNESLKISSINYRFYSINFGYSYNWVFAKNFLFNETLTPIIGYNINKGERLELDKKLFRYHSYNFDIISRTAIVWNTGLFYAGASCVAHTYSYKKTSYSILNTLFKVNAYAGINFWKKKAYRKKKK